MLHRKPEIGKISKDCEKTLYVNCMYKKSIFVIGKNKQEKSEKFKFLLQTRFK